MLKRICILMMTLVVSTSLWAQPFDKTDPYPMMKAVANKTFARLKTEQEAVRQNPEQLKVIVEQELMPYVNTQYAALKLLGPNLKGAKREDVKVFINAFHDYLVTSYAQVLTQYSDQQIEFGPEPKVSPTQRIMSAKVAIVDAPRPNINLEFKLRKNSKNGEWEAFDMIAEGISLLSSKQSEWNSKLRREGILAVAKELEKQAALPIRFEGKK